MTKSKIDLDELELPEDLPGDQLMALKSLAGTEALLDSIKGLFGFNTSKDAQLSGVQNGSMMKQLSVAAVDLNRLISKAIGANDNLLKSFLNDVPTYEAHEVKFTNNSVKRLTAEGELDRLLNDQATLAKTLTIIIKHQSEVDAYLSERLGLLKRVSDKKETGDLVEVIQKLDDITPPKLSLPNKSGETQSSEVLPGAKVIEYHLSSAQYSMSEKDTDTKETDFELSSSELKSFITELRHINTQYKALGEMVNRFSSFVQKWGGVVKQTQSHLDKLNQVSPSVKNRIISHLPLETNLVNLYTVFLPRLIGYVNDYVVEGSNCVEKIIK